MPLLKLMLHDLPDGVVPLTVVPLTEIDPDDVLTVGSDGHDLQKRKPVLIDAVKDVKRHYGWDYAERLFISNPECIIYNQYIER